jgi:riboflavin synthase
LFTGIIEDLGAIARIDAVNDGVRITIRTALPLARMAIGESIAVNGCCLTVTGKGRGTFTADVSAESLRRTVLGSLNPGDRVNLERCLTLEKLLGGHLVSGHVDGVGRIAAITPEGNSQLFTFEVAAAQARYLVEKGSVFNIRPVAAARRARANGNGRGAKRSAGATFQVALIPHTLKMTTLGFKRPGDAVNIESDLLVKYVERVTQPSGRGSGRARAALAEGDRR